MIYLIPRTTGMPDEVLTLLSAAKVVLREPKTLFQMIQKLEPDALNLVALSDENFSLLLRHINNLLPELPTVVADCPGVHYSAAFMMSAAKIPLISWGEFEAKLGKTGLMATTADSLHRLSTQEEGDDFLDHPDTFETGTVDDVS